MKIEGVYTALVTPFTRDAKRVDYAKLRELVEWQIQAGINGLVVLGSTGEHQAVSEEERAEIIKTVVQTTNKRVPVVAGTGSNLTTTTIKLTQAAKDAGADGCMVVCPFYVKPTQRGLYEHFKAVAAVGLPVIIYNNPSRTGVSIAPETVAELSKVPGIVALKDATGGVDQALQVSALCDITLFAGEDALALPMMAIGATGVMSILSNAGRVAIQSDGRRWTRANHVILLDTAAPKKVLALTEAVQRGEYATARRVQRENVRSCRENE
ncbi:Dihydrodipicolinate synthase, partial [Globisporangium splendens]